MKSLVQPIILFIGFISILLSVRTISQPSDHYYINGQNWDDYFKTRIANQTICREYKQFIRWKEFWRNRVDCSDTARSGKISTFYNALEIYRSSQGFLSNSINPAPWTFCGPDQIGSQHHGLVSAIYVDTANSPDCKTIFIGTNASGIWKTSDGGGHWSNVTDSSGFYFIGVTDIKGDPFNTNIIYASIGGGGYFGGPTYGIGILKSEDAGATWHVIYPLQPNEKIASHCLLTDPTTPGRLFAGIGEKVVRLQNTGMNWEAVVLYNNTDTSSEMHPRFIRDIEMKPGSPDTLYIATDHKCYQNTRRANIIRIIGATTSAFESQVLTPFSQDSLFSERYEIAVTPLNPNSIYVIGEYHPQNTDALRYVAIWKSNDKGESWQVKFVQNQSASYNAPEYLAQGRVDYFKMEFLISPTDTTVLYIGGNTVSRLIQSEGSWSIQQTTGYLTAATNNYHPDTRAAIILRGSTPGSFGAQDMLFCGNDGGISKSTNGIRQWQNINGNGLGITEFIGIGSAEKQPFWIGGGTIDNGFFTNTTSSWVSGHAPDVGRSIVDKESPNLVHVNIWSSSDSIYSSQTSNNYGLTFSQSFWTTPGQSCLPNKPLVFNPLNPNTVFSGGHDLFRTFNIKANQPVFQKIPVIVNSFPPISISEKINCIAISETDTNVLVFSYAGPHYSINTHKLLKWIDGGTSFIDLLSKPGNTALKDALTDLGITDIIISPDNADKIWVTLGGFANQEGEKRVYFSNDGGLSFADISDGLKFSSELYNILERRE